MMFELIATTTFGLEAVVRREIENIGLKVIRTEDGKVTFLGDERAIVKANLWLRAADRILLKMAEFEAEVSEDLFQGVKDIPWEDIIPEDGKVIVTCSTVRSKLRSEPNNQKTVKKAIVDRLKSRYGIAEDTRLSETGDAFTVKVALLKDRATLTIDTSGEALHKRGYRVAPVTAPIKETMAAALIELSFWKPGRVLIDPCAGSGTIAIEAALMAKGIAPGFTSETQDSPVRRFASEKWRIIDHKIWDEEREKVLANKDGGRGTSKEIASQAAPRIFAFDIDEKALDAAKENAKAAGVYDLIEFRKGDIADTLYDLDRRLVSSGIHPDDASNGILITNPPYGERIGDQKALDHILKVLGKFMKNDPGWSVFLISPDKRTEEKSAGRRADRRRKLYNGNIEVCYYQFHGTKPVKKL